VAAGAPLLFGLSASLVKILTSLLSTVDVGHLPTNAPFTLTKITISVNFITYLSLAFLIATSLMSSMIIGLVNKGDEKAGLKYAVPLMAVSVTIFFLVKTLMASYFAGFFT
jgi:archaellum biogenesis protein FlaJ (TadC family)